MTKNFVPHVVLIIYFPCYPPLLIDKNSGIIIASPPRKINTFSRKKLNQWPHKSINIKNNKNSKTTKSYSELAIATLTSERKIIRKIKAVSFQTQNIMIKKSLIKRDPKCCRKITRKRKLRAVSFQTQSKLELIKSVHKGLIIL